MTQHVRDRAPAVSEPRCLVCRTGDVAERIVANPALGRRQRVRVCGLCGYVAMPDNTHDYTTATSARSLGLAARCGTEERTGREFGMAQLGIEVLGRRDLSVMVYGVGRSLDNRHIATLPEVKRTVIGDIMRIRDDGEFIDITRASTETFDVVIASEVVEHFTEPQSDFRHLFGWVASDGVLICSTNIHDGGPLERQRYIFGRGHTSYYSPASLRLIAAAAGWQVDFRLPVLASESGPKGRRKRYVIFSQSREVMDGVSDYFGRHPYAPSEPPAPKGTTRRGTAARGDHSGDKGRAAGLVKRRRALWGKSRKGG